MKLSDLATGSDWTVWIVFVKFEAIGKGEWNGNQN